VYNEDVRETREIQELAVELADHSYGKVHRAGCRDLRDALAIGSATRRSEVAALLRDATGWDLEDGETVDTAPCVRLDA
jgi:hypothetical protein